MYTVVHKIWGSVYTIEYVRRVDKYLYGITDICYV